MTVAYPELRFLYIAPRVEALRTSTLGWGNATPTELPGVRTFFYGLTIHGRWEHTIHIGLTIQGRWEHTFHNGLTIHGRWEQTILQWANYTWSLGADHQHWANIILTLVALYSGLERKTWANLLVLSPSIGTMVTICNQIAVIM